MKSLTSPDFWRAYAALPPEARAGLLGCIGDLIESRYCGRIRKRYMSELRVAHKRPSA